MKTVTINLDPDIIADEIWDRHKEELGAGCLTVRINASTSGAFFVGDHMPISICSGSKIQVSDKQVTGTIKGLSYCITIWEMVDNATGPE